ncbi:isocitrate lyase/PEP mutase family protein [Mesobacterium pallidum]|uniref:isocitrate lyase/PEP mutase family protein n=1 Tax=Mesobacterium pallidum TaxID=2872037 RepID=UPI001EE1EDB3|nr:isocitrate lyase/phosphoenolpyruvate mutase family protein [Mesobacterium pallidum]
MTFRALHRPGAPFILANAWDVGSARMLAALGAEALATSSAAHAFTLGRPDGGGVTRDEALAHAQDLVAATPLPVQGDFENGFGEAPETCAETVSLSAEIGLAGICIEDTALPGHSAYDFDLSVERIRASSAAARALPGDFVLCARADGALMGGYDAEEALRRLAAFAEAGADVLYAPMPGDVEVMRRICALPKPVNVLAIGVYKRMNLADLSALGAARVSLGSQLARVTHQAILDAARPLLELGDFSGFDRAAPGAEIDALLRRGAR